MEGWKSITSLNNLQVLDITDYPMSFDVLKEIANCVTLTSLSLNKTPCEALFGEEGIVELRFPFIFKDFLKFPGEEYVRELSGGDLIFRILLESPNDAELGFCFIFRSGNISTATMTKI